MGYTSNIKNAINGKRYLVSTAEDHDGGWQTAVFERKIFGISNPLHPAMFTGAPDEEQARLVHARVEAIVAQLPPTEWETAKWELVKEVMDTLIESDTVVDDFDDLSQQEEGVALMYAVCKNPDCPLSYHSHDGIVLIDLIQGVQRNHREDVPPSVSSIERLRELAPRILQRGLHCSGATCGEEMTRSCCTTQFRSNGINNLAGLCNTL
jgi:hypothetical protein